jgi:ankyrin repeat protein
MTLNELFASLGDSCFASKLSEYLSIEGHTINDRDWYAQTPLMIAARKGHLGSVQLLIEQGAEVNLQDSQNRTALRYATNSENGMDIVRILLQKGASPTEEDVVGLKSDVCDILESAETFILLPTGTNDSVCNHNKKLNELFSRRGAQMALQTNLIESLAKIVASYLTLDTGGLKIFNDAFRMASPIVHAPRLLTDVEMSAMADSPANKNNATLLK